MPSQPLPSLLQHHCLSAVEAQAGVFRSARPRGRQGGRGKGRKISGKTDLRIAVVSELAQVTPQTTTPSSVYGPLYKKHLWGRRAIEPLKPLWNDCCEDVHGHRTQAESDSIMQTSAAAKQHRNGRCLLRFKTDQKLKAEGSTSFNLILQPGIPSFTKVTSSIPSDPDQPGLLWLSGDVDSDRTSTVCLVDCSDLNPFTGGAQQTRDRDDRCQVPGGASHRPICCVRSLRSRRVRSPEMLRS